MKNELNEIIETEVFSIVQNGAFDGFNSVYVEKEAERLANKINDIIDNGFIVSSVDSGMQNEINRLIKENQQLHKEIESGPLKVKGNCTLVEYPSNITESVNELKEQLNNGLEFYVNANYKDIAVLTVRPIIEDEQIFYGLVVGVEKVAGVENDSNIYINDIIQFQVCDLFDN